MTDTMTLTRKEAEYIKSDLSRIERLINHGDVILANSAVHELIKNDIAILNSKLTTNKER